MRYFTFLLSAGLALIFLPLQTLSGGKDIVGGAGLLESEFVMVWENRNQWFKPCLLDPMVCHLNAKEIQVISDFFKLLAPSKLIFESFLKNPALRENAIDQHQIIATVREPNAQIFVNTDNLYAPGSDPFKNRGVGRPLELLYSAVLYQFGMPQAQAQRLAHNIATFWIAEQYIYDLAQIGQKPLSVMVFTARPLGVFITSSQSILNALDLISPQLNCPGGNNAPSLNYLRNSYWSEINALGQGIRATLSGTIGFSCAGDREAAYQAKFYFQVAFVKNPDGLTYDFDFPNLSFEVYDVAQIK